MIDGLNQIFACVRVILLHLYRLGTSVGWHTQKLPRGPLRGYGGGVAKGGEDYRLAVRRHRRPVGSVWKVSRGAAPSVIRPAEYHSTRRVTVLRHDVEGVALIIGEPVHHERHPPRFRERGVPGTGSSTAVPGADHQPVERICIRDRALPQVDRKRLVAGKSV